MAKLTNTLRKKITNKLIYNLKEQRDIISLTFVGSFIDKNNIEGFNDIDLILITKKLNQNSYKKYINILSKVNPLEFGINKSRIVINPTFGPLKLNNDNKDLVIHLMIYDINGHINHCIKSPFTVYDWERSEFYYKKKLSYIFTVGTIQLNDFLKARRGVENYLNDLINKQVSYREYKIHNKGYKIITKNLELDKRDKFEFYYHIVKNLILNYVKFIYGKNKLFRLNKNYKKIYLLFGKKFYLDHINNINYLIDSKRKSNFNLEKKFDTWIINFVKDYSKNLKKISITSKKIIFLRHAETKFNDGSFFGQKRDPSIIKKRYFRNIIKENYSKIYTSPLKRCTETVEIVSKKKNFISDNDLLEINYGDAEGMKVSNLHKKYPYLKKQWDQKKDPKFPNGESYSDVINRINKFIKKLTRNNLKKSCVITHNVFLRVLIGQIFNIPREKWYKLNILHLMKLEFVVINKKLYPNIERDKLYHIFSNLI